MAKISQQFKDKAKTIKDYPKTLIKAVYGDDGKRPDNIISDITSDIDSTKAKIGTTDISKYGDGTVTGAIKAACDKADANETAIADVNSNLIILEASTQVLMTANRELDDITEAITIPSRYKPIAMYAYNLNNKDNVSALPLLIRSDGKVLYHAKNHSASDQGVIGIVIRITFKRM